MKFVELVTFYAGPGGGASGGIGGTPGMIDPSPSTNLLFASLLRFLSGVYEGLVNVSSIVLRFMNKEVTFPVIDFTNGLAVATWTGHVADLVLGVGFSVIAYGIIWKWFKEFIH